MSWQNYQSKQSVANRLLVYLIPLGLRINVQCAGNDKKQLFFTKSLNNLKLIFIF